MTYHAKLGDYIAIKGRTRSAPTGVVSDRGDAVGVYDCFSAFLSAFPVTERHFLSWDKVGDHDFVVPRGLEII